MKKFILIAKRTDVYNRTIRDVLGMFSTPEDAILSSKQFVKFYDKNSFKGFSVEHIEIDDNTEKLYAICVNPFDMDERVTTYTLPMDEVTLARYTGRTVSHIEFATTGKTHWEALEKATKLYNENKGEEE
jgi:hypothetical protein